MLRFQRDSKKQRGFYAKDVYSQFLSSTILFNTTELDKKVPVIKSKWKELKCQVSENSKTSKLRIEYLKVQSTVQKLILADWNGDSNLHLKTLSGSLPVFVACGHCHYTKPVYLQQNMSDIQRKTEAAYKQFKEGKFGVRRSDRKWKFFVFIGKTSYPSRNLVLIISEAAQELDTSHWSSTHGTKLHQRYSLTKDFD